MVISKNRIFLYSIRCQYLDEQQVIDMQESGCKGVYLGIKSGSNYILKNMNKKATREQFLKGVELLSSKGIPTFGSFIIGFPGETEKTFEETIGFIQQSGIEFFNVKIFYYDKNTLVGRKSSEYGLKGQGMKWKHKSMSSIEVFDRAEYLMRSIKNATYVPQHSGEIWEIAYFNQCGFSNSALTAFYGIFSEILEIQLNEKNYSKTKIQKKVKEMANIFHNN